MALHNNWLKSRFSAWLSKSLAKHPIQIKTIQASKSCIVHNLIKGRETWIYGLRGNNYVITNSEK